MFSSKDLLARLDAANVARKDVAACLGTDISAITRMYQGQRQLKLDEAKKLVERFRITDDQPIDPLTIPIARLLILHALNEFDVKADSADPRVEELARDFRAFSRFALDPRVREDTSAVGGFLQGARLTRDPTA